MPIEFAQPGPYSASISSAYGAAQAMRDFLPFLQRAYGGGGGGGGEGRAGGGGGWGAGIMPSSDGGGGGSSGGGGGVDPLALYQGKAEIDAYMRKQEQDRQIAAIQAMTADPDANQAQIEALQRKMAAGGGDTSEASGGDTSAAEARNQPEGDTSEAQAPEYDLRQEDQPYGGTNAQGESMSAAEIAAPMRQGAGPPNPQPQAIPGPSPEFTQADALQLQRLSASRTAVQAQLRNGMIDPQTARRMIMQIQTGIDPLRQQQQAAQAAAQQAQAAQRMHEIAEQTSLENMNDEERSAWIARRSVRLPNGGWGYVDRRGDIKPLPQEHLDRQANAVAAQQDRQDRHDETTRTAFRTALNDVEKAVLGNAENRKPPTEEQQQRITEMMAARGFHSADLGEHMATARELREQRPMTGRPPQQWTDEQRQRIGAFDRLRNQVREASADAPNSRWMHNQLAEIRQAEDMFKNYGTVRRMPKQVRERYASILSEVDRQRGLPWASSDPQAQPVISPQALPTADYRVNRGWAGAIGGR